MAQRAGICTSKKVIVALFATSPAKAVTTVNLIAHQVIQKPISPIIAHL